MASSGPALRSRHVQPSGRRTDAVDIYRNWGGFALKAERWGGESRLGLGYHRLVLVVGTTMRTMGLCIQYRSSYVLGKCSGGIILWMYK